MKRTALLIPTYKRFADLLHTLRNTHIDDRARFVIVANLDDKEFEYLNQTFGNVSIIIDERQYGKLGGCKAYNLAYQIARENGFDYAILYADDIIPFRKKWLDDLYQLFIDQDGQFGVFSSDECHHGSYGWNIIIDSPIAHFFVIKCSISETLFDIDFKQYLIDVEIAVRLKNEGVKLELLPIKLNHLRSGLHREYMNEHYEYDLKVFISKYPNYQEVLTKVTDHYFLPHKNEKVSLDHIDRSELVGWPKNKVPILVKIKTFIKAILKLNK